VHETAHFHPIQSQTDFQPAFSRRLAHALRFLVLVCPWAAAHPGPQDAPSDLTCRGYWRLAAGSWAIPVGLAFTVAFDSDESAFGSPLVRWDSSFSNGAYAVPHRLRRSGSSACAPSRPVWPPFFVALHGPDAAELGREVASSSGGWQVKTEQQQVLPLATRHSHPPPANLPERKGHNPTWQCRSSVAPVFKCQRLLSRFRLAVREGVRQARQTGD